MAAHSTGATFNVPPQVVSTIRNALVAAVVTGGSSLGGAATNATPAAAVTSGQLAAIAAGALTVLTALYHAVVAAYNKSVAKGVAAVVHQPPAAPPA